MRKYWTKQGLKHSLLFWSYIIKSMTANETLTHNVVLGHQTIYHPTIADRIKNVFVNEKRKRNMHGYSFNIVKMFRPSKCSCIPIWVLLCKIQHVVQTKRPQKTSLERSSETWLSLVKLYLICHCQSLLRPPPLLLRWPGSHGWSWQHGCWCHSGCWRRRPGLSWCWLQLHFACCSSGCPGTSVAGSAEQEKQVDQENHWKSEPFSMYELLQYNFSYPMYGTTLDTAPSTN